MTGCIVWPFIAKGIHIQEIKLSICNNSQLTGNSDRIVSSGICSVCLCYGPGILTYCCILTGISSADRCSCQGQSFACNHTINRSLCNIDTLFVSCISLTIYLVCCNCYRINFQRILCSRFVCIVRIACLYDYTYKSIRYVRYTRLRICPCCSAIGRILIGCRSSLRIRCRPVSGVAVCIIRSIVAKGIHIQDFQVCSRCNSQFSFYLDLIVIRGICPSVCLYYGPGILLYFCILIDSCSSDNCAFQGQCFTCNDTTDGSTRNINTLFCSCILFACFQMSLDFCLVHFQCILCCRLICIIRIACFYSYSYCTLFHIRYTRLLSGPSLSTIGRILIGCRSTLRIRRRSDSCMTFCIICSLIAKGINIEEFKIRILCNT